MMSDDIPEGMASLVGDYSEVVETMDDMEVDEDAQAPKPGLSIAPVRMTSEVGEDGQKKVPGIKIIGLSSELKKAMTGEESKDGSVEDEEDEEEEDEESEEEEDEEEYEEESPLVKTPTVTVRKVQQVSTPGTAGDKEDTSSMRMPFAGSTAMSSVKKRGRPSRADLALREQERQEALARGEPDPELKRKRRKPLKLNDADSEEDSREERKRRKREEREERRHKKAKPQSEETEDTDVEEKPKKKGRKKKILTAEEEAARDEERKRKYKEIREKQKAKLERRKAYLIRKRDERKEKKAEEKKKHEEHLRRMAELRSQYLDDNASDLPADLDENSQSSNPTKMKKKWGDVSQTELAGGVYNPLAHVTAETLFEYKWPLEGRHSEHYFLQEQVTEFLDAKSFKRKYPDCPRRTINMEERDFLIDMKIVNETQADLGLTAIPSASMLDIMSADFYDKYEEYLAVINERKEKSSRNYNYSSGCGDTKIEDAVMAAAEFNKKFNEERASQRSAYFDIQTFTCQYPKANKGIMKVLKKPRPGNYPVAMIPGQFVDHYRFRSLSMFDFKLMLIFSDRTAARSYDCSP